ncbi:unnamed protein product [Mytilus coruscus]|uniref:Uncharacterized protein n=1 Tax=Mytilus coruscus TaxID=42192 RepID=A0A6J8ER66_MYTCO|nr:unnamed protein product [Mytilus coruscus]
MDINKPRTLETGGTTIGPGDMDINKSRTLETQETKNVLWKPGDTGVNKPRTTETGDNVRRLVRRNTFIDPGNGIKAQYQTLGGIGRRMTLGKMLSTILNGTQPNSTNKNEIGAKSGFQRYIPPFVLNMNIYEWIPRKFHQKVHDDLLNRIDILFLYIYTYNHCLLHQSICFIEAVHIPANNMNSFIISIIVFLIANATVQTVFAQHDIFGQMPGQTGLLGQMTIADVLKLVPRGAQSHKNPENAKLAAMLANVPSFVLNDQASRWIPLSYQKVISKDLLAQKQHNKLVNDQTTWSKVDQQKTTPSTKPMGKQQTITKQMNSSNGMLKQQLANEPSNGQNYQQTTPSTKPMKKQLPMTEQLEPTNTQIMNSLNEMAMQQAQMMILMNKMLMQQITTPLPLV